MKRFSLFALVVAMFAACTSNITDEQAIKIDVPTPETLVGTFEGEDSRIQLDNGKTVWTADDLVSVFYLSNANQKWQYQGQTGDRVGNLKQVEAGNATETMKRVVVVYPYNENYYINTDTYNVKGWLPAEQTYLAESYGLNGNIMISQSEYNQFSLKNVCGWLKLQLTGNGEKVQSISLKGNNGEQVAGEIYINSADATAALAADMGSADDNDNSAGGNLVFDNSILTEVVLHCGDGVTLSSEPTAFYIGLPPQEFTQGISLEIKATDGHIMTKSTNKSVLINRNAIQPMAAVDFVPSYPLSNEIFYTATAMVTPYASDVFGANIVSNIYDAEKGYGVITFDGPVTSIGYCAFSDCCSLTNVTIPDSVTSIETSAFQGCNKLTEVTIPDSVTSVKRSAFAFCDRLKSFYGKFASEDNRCLIVNGTLKAFAPADLLEYTIPSDVTSIGDFAFRGCYKLTNIAIPDSVTSIDGGVFENCGNLAAFYGKFASDDNRCLIVNGVLKSFAPAGLTEYEIVNGVTSIEEYTFYSCSSLISVTIPETITNIRYAAFANCTKLKTVYCKATTPPAGGRYMFSHYSNDKSPLGCTIYVPADSFEAYKVADGWSEYADNFVAYDFEKGEVVEIIPETWKIYYTATAKVEPNNKNAFGANIISNTYENGKGVIKFDGNVTSIGERAFYNCTSLASITIPDSITEIGNSAFCWCTKLTSVTIPDSVTEIGYGAFASCRSLTSVTIPDSVTEIGNSAFRYCTSLTSVTIPDSVTSIGNDAFERCTSLTSVTIPDSVTEIGEWAFLDCTSLTSVTIGDSVTEIGYGAFANCTSLTSVTIPDSVTSIGGNGFSGCTSLTSVTIPDSVTSIGESAFDRCTSLTAFYGKVASADNRCLVVNGVLNSFAPAGLTEYTIPDSVTSIGEDAFYKCISLTSVTIPDSVTSIGEDAFRDCTSLKEVYCKPTTPSSGGSDMFYNNASGRKIYVPRASVDAYKAAEYWSEYADNFVAYDFEKGEVVEIIPETWKIYYTATAKVEPYNEDGFGAIIKSNEWDSTTGEGVITFNGEVSTIGANAFYMRSTLQSIHIPKKVTSIKAGAFRECLKLKNVYLNSGIESIGSNAFVGCFDFYNSTYGSFNIHINSIEDWCKIDMPKEITSGQETIYLKVNDISVRDIIIPETITTIKPYAFKYVSVRSVTIHEGISSVGDRAFYECGLKEVYCKSLTPPVGGSDMFEYNSNELKIYVPRASVDAYKAASGWSYYKSDIEPYDF